MAGPTEIQQNRRDNGPTTDRGAARKRKLLEAARRVFETKGFVETRVSDIVKDAGVSHGTFYTYFDTKEAVFTAIAHDVITSMLEAITVSIPTSGLESRAQESVQRFVDAYEPHAVMLGLMEQVGTFSPEMRDLRLEVRATFVRRTKRGLDRAKADGVADVNLDTAYTSEILGAMLEYTCYLWFSLGKEFERERLIHALAEVWTKSMRSSSAIA